MELKKILLDRPEILSDKVKIKGLLSDTFEGDEAKVNRMMKAYEIGIVEALLSGSGDDLQKSTLVNKLINRHDMISDKAEWSIRTWFSILDKKVLAKYKKYLDEEKKKKPEVILYPEEIVDTEIEEPKEVLNNGYDPEDFQRFINPVHKHTSGTVIPCGVGVSDNGFVLYGLTPTNLSSHTHGPILGLIYNYLIRNTKMTEEDRPKAIRDNDTYYATDFRMIYRYEIIIVSAIRCGLAPKNIIQLKPLDHVKEFKLALKSINVYIGIFCRLAGVAAFEISLAENSKRTTSLKSSRADIYVAENKEYTVARELYFAKKINYHLSKDNLVDLEYLLREISPFDSFKEGQFEALCDMMNSKGHSVCIMPTGSGKSLIYYFASLLQPLPAFVISPTDILIRDQIRNLRRFHHMDNVSYLQMAENFDFERMELCNSLIYLTPATFQSRDLFVRFRHLNEEQKVSYIVLDEIHCLSNWGHDFRPEYLMLSKHLNKYLDRTSFLGFTATANFTVVEDIQKQLNIPQSNFFSPITFEKYNASYNYKAFSSTDGMYQEVASIAQRIVKNNERAIVFTKNDDVSRKVADAIGHEADVFLPSNPQAYYQFADGYCKILVTSEELGVGINFSDVTNIIHFGLPISKNEYVQEVGRAGRGNEHIKSFVLFLEPTEQNVNPLLLKREAAINHMAQILAKMDNDYADSYHKLNMNADTSDILLDRLIDIFSDLRERGRPLYDIPYDIEIIENVKQYLYMLYASGYISDWYSYKAIEKKKQISIMIDISATNNAYYNIEENMVNRMKKRCTDYFIFMGNDRKSISNLSKANTAKEIIRVYVDWYYEKYLYHHKEEFLDMFDFIMSNLDGDVDKITDEIKEYFILPFVKIKTDEDYYLGLTVLEIANKMTAGVGKSTLANIERINSNRYSYKLDYALFMGFWRMSGRFDKNRLERFWTKMSNNEQISVKQSLINTYKLCSNRAKWDFLRYIDGESYLSDMTVMKVLDDIYKDGYRDMIYYGLMAKGFNEKLHLHNREEV